jgi:hypothetical protein
MMRFLSAIMAALLALALSWAPASAQEVSVTGVRVQNDKLIISSTLTLEPAQVDEIVKGVEKEIVFYIDLFRDWRNWPDEFMIGQTITRTLRCDPVKKEYVATSLMGRRLTERRFSDCYAMIAWTLSLKDIEIIGTAGLEPAEYYIKTTVESKIRYLPPFIDLLFFFVKDTEYRITDESAHFPLGLPNE